jgi:hypothetical protein
MTSEQKVYVSIASLLSLVILGMSADLIYTNYDDKRPHHEVGTCLRTVDKEGNEFEETTYDYVIIIEVGKERYRYIRIYNFYGGKWNSYMTTNKFISIDKYREPNVVHCAEVKKLIGLE